MYSLYVTHTVYNYRLFTTFIHAHLPHFLLAGFGLCFAGLFVEIIFQPMTFSLPLWLSLSFCLGAFFSVKNNFFFVRIGLCFHHAIENSYAHILNVY